jgi:hypothetical protein
MSDTELSLNCKHSRNLSGVTEATSSPKFLGWCPTTLVCLVCILSRVTQSGVYYSQNASPNQVGKRQALRMTEEKRKVGFMSLLQ